MNAFIEHHQQTIRFDYSCFDRILLNGVIQVLQNPACIVGFLKLDFGHWMIDCASTATFGAESAARLTLLQRLFCEISARLSVPIVTTT